MWTTRAYICAQRADNQYIHKTKRSISSLNSCKYIIFSRIIHNKDTNNIPICQIKQQKNEVAQQRCSATSNIEVVTSYFKISSTIHDAPPTLSITKST